MLFKIRPHRLRASVEQTNCVLIGQKHCRQREETVVHETKKRTAVRVAKIDAGERKGRKETECRSSYGPFGICGETEIHRTDEMIM